MFTIQYTNIERRNQFFQIRILHVEMSKKTNSFISTHQKCEFKKLFYYI